MSWARGPHQPRPRGGVFRWQTLRRSRKLAGSIHLRQLMPSPRPTCFRLLAELPLKVAFKSITYFLAIV